MDGHRALTGEEILVMEKAGCVAEDWSRVRVAAGFDSRRVRNVRFGGSVNLGALAGSVSMPDGVKPPVEITDSTVIDCDLGDHVRICRVGHLACYRIAPGAILTDIGAMATRPGATFGNGTAVSAVNEAGGREIRIFNEISSQFAYLAAMHRYRRDLIEKLDRMAQVCVEGSASDRGHVGEKAVVTRVGEILDVEIGPAAQVSDAMSLRNGTVLSEPGAATRVGAGVIASDFIIGEGSQVDGGAILSHCFVGQGVQVGKGFSAENSLFFANSECFHGEACSIFAGPYTVTHHRGTLLIAGIYSFFNAGSGTNQSNHMYKLGPVHQGTLERGSKMGSFSYMLWPSVIGPFCVIIGKHLTNFNIGDLPFSYLTEEGGASYLTPGMNLYTVGTVRDGQKWPTRDRRKAGVKRDLIRFEVQSPYVIQKMIRAEALLGRLHEETPREVEQVRYGGAVIKRLLLRHGARTYGGAIDAYLQGRILERARPALAGGGGALRAALAEEPGSLYSPDWADLSGMLVCGERLRRLEDDIAAGRIGSVAEFQAAFTAACEAYPADEWAWVRRTYEARSGRSVDALGEADLKALEATYAKASATAVRKILADAEKEFGEGAMVGYGADGTPADAAADFETVRGTFAGNSFVKQMRAELEKATGS